MPHAKDAKDAKGTEKGKWLWFGFRISFGLRASGFGLRISCRDTKPAEAGTPNLWWVGTARCAVRAAFSVARPGPRFRPLNAGGDIAARCPYLQPFIAIPDPV